MPPAGRRQLLNLFESYIVFSPSLNILKDNQQSSGLPFAFEGLSHGLKSVHRTLFTSLRSADLFAAYSIVSETHLNADVRWTSACRRLDGGNSLIYSSPISSLQIDVYRTVFRRSCRGDHRSPVQRNLSNLPNSDAKSQHSATAGAH